MYRTTNRPNTRIEVADALRGIAVAGIILFHAREHFNLYWSALDLSRAGFGSWEQPVADALGFLLSGKMYAIFALLFGLSFFIQSDNQAQRGNDFSLRFAWRMVLLFGIFHGEKNPQTASHIAVTTLYELQALAYGTSVLAKLGILFSIPLLRRYNGQRGPKSKLIQWGFYWFYPIHLLVLFLLSQLV